MLLPLLLTPLITVTFTSAPAMSTPAALPVTPATVSYTHLDVYKRQIPHTDGSLVQFDFWSLQIITDLIEELLIIFLFTRTFLYRFFQAFL